MLSLDSLRLPPIITDEDWSQLFPEDPLFSLSETTEAPDKVETGVGAALDSLVVKRGKRDRALKAPAHSEGGGSSEDGELGVQVVPNEPKKSRKLDSSHLSARVGASLPASPINEYLGWNKFQIWRLETATTVHCLFDLYKSFNPRRFEEIKVFFAHVFSQYFQIKVDDKNCVGDRLKDRVSQEVRKVCDSKFPIFHRFLAYRGFAIQCMFRNIDLYVPGETEKFYSEISKKEKNLSPVAKCFMNAIIRTYGADLGILNPKDPSSVWHRKEMALTLKG